MEPEALVGKRVRLHGGLATVVSIRRRTGNGGACTPMAVVRFDGFSAQSLVRPAAIERLADERGAKLR